MNNRSTANREEDVALAFEKVADALEEILKSLKLLRQVTDAVIERLQRLEQDNFDRQQTGSSPGKDGQT